jgi:hypothetical protein
MSSHGHGRRQLRHTASGTQIRTCSILEGEAVKLTFLGKDSNSAQRWKVIDQDALAALAERGLPDTETAVEIPIELLRHFPAS